jgi:hypothetical protein
MRILFFTEYTWAFGHIYSAACKYLYQHGIDADMLDWKKSYTMLEIQSLLNTYDYIVSTHNGILIMTNDYRIPHDRLILQVHGETDLVNLIQDDGLDFFHQVAAYWVVSDSIVAHSVGLGIGVIPETTPLGIDTVRFRNNITTSLQRAGYASIMSRTNSQGLDIKRGNLARLACEQAGLSWHNVESRCWQSMPNWYEQVDAVLMSSCQEGASLPVIEACASGKLVLGTPVGHWPLCTSQGMGILAPLCDRDYVDFVSDTLIFYHKNQEIYQAHCVKTQQQAQAWDWSKQIQPWVKLLKQLPRKISC